MKQKYKVMITGERKQTNSPQGGTQQFAEEMVELATVP